MPTAPGLAVRRRYAALALLLALSSCTDAPPLSPEAQAPPAPAQNVSPPVFVADNTVPLPPDNHPDNGILHYWFPMLTIPSSPGYYLIKVTGKVSHDWNELCPLSQCPNNLDGATLGPLQGGGGGVELGYASPGVNVAGGALPSRWYPKQHPDGTGTAFVLVTNPGKVVWVRRSGLQTGCRKSGSACDPNNRQPQYFLSGQQTISLHSVPVPLSVAGPAAVATGQPGAFTAMVVENLPVDKDANGNRRIFWSFMEGDTLATPGGGTSRNIDACRAALTCSYIPAKSGRMKVTAYVNEQFLTGYSDIVRLVANPPTLTCPPSVTRGQGVSCSVSNLTGVVVQSWSFVGEQFANDPTLHVTETTSLPSWAGIAVEGGVVSANILINGVPKTLVDTFTVANRSWRWGNGDWHYSQGTAPICNSAPPTPGSIHIGWNRNAGVPQALCGDPAYHRWVLPDPRQNPMDGYTLAEVPTGPNKGRWYVQSAQYRIDRASNLNPHWLPGGPASPLAGSQASECVTAGMTSPVSVNLHAFNEVCKGVDMDPFIAGAWGHEGYGAFGGQGHQGLAEAAAAQTDGDPLYKIEWWTGATEAYLRDQVLNGVDAASVWIDSATDDVGGAVTGNWPGGQLWTWQSGGAGFTLTTIPQF